MGITTEAERALEFYKTAYPNLIARDLEGQAQDLVAKAELATRIQIAKAFLGPDMFAPDTPAHSEAVRLLDLADGTIPTKPELELPNRKLQSVIERTGTFIIQDFRFMRRAESNIPALFKPEKLVALLKQLKNVIWPDYLNRVRSKRYSQPRLDLVSRVTKYELAFTHQERFRDLRSSRIFTETVEPIIGAPAPTSDDYSSLGLSKGTKIQIVNVAGKLAADTLKSLKTDSKKPNLPKQALDLNNHPGKVHYEPGDADLLNWPSSTIHADEDEDGPGIHRADEV